MYNMYEVRIKEMRIVVVCEQCATAGIVRCTCRRCNGTGVHKKTIKWHYPKEVQIVKIDRVPYDMPEGYGYSKEELERERDQLRYWTSEVCYYSEHGKHVHFTLHDAERECRRRNIAQIGKNATLFLERK